MSVSFGHASVSLSLTLDPNSQAKLESVSLSLTLDPKSQAKLELMTDCYWYWTHYVKPAQLGLVMTSFIKLFMS